MPKWPVAPLQRCTSSCSCRQLRDASPFYGVCIPRVLSNRYHPICRVTALTLSRKVQKRNGEDRECGGFLEPGVKTAAPLGSTGPPIYLFRHSACYFLLDNCNTSAAKHSKKSYSTRAKHQKLTAIDIKALLVYKIIPFFNLHESENCLYGGIYHLPWANTFRFGMLFGGKYLCK